MKNLLVYGDNLTVMRDTLADETVDLIYLDPPFNSNRSYNILFGASDTDDDRRAQINAFDDFWRWNIDDEHLLDDLRRQGHRRVSDVVDAIGAIVGQGAMLSYLVNMAVRFVEMRRLLKPSGSIYVHCDQTASHYLKVLLDGIFGGDNFLNNIVWSYGLGGSSTRYWPRKHDDILWYSKTRDGHYFDADMIPATSQRMKGKLKKAPDHWDIPALNNMAAERLGYPTQKPVALLERIVRSSCPDGGVVLDPFCGCGTTLDAAERLGRQWVGIDVSFLAVDLIRTRLADTFGSPINSRYDLVGVPADVGGADALYERSPTEFRRWAVSLVDATPTDRVAGGDRDAGDRDAGGYVDGWIRFPLYTHPNEHLNQRRDEGREGRVGVGRIAVVVDNDLSQPTGMNAITATIAQRAADMGVVISRHEPSTATLETVERCGYFEPSGGGRRYQKIQIVTVADLLDGRRLDLPGAYLPYLSANRFVADHPTLPGMN